jgi:hypothetical protein
VFTLGGTIAMQGTSRRGVAPALSASDLLAAVPGLDATGVELRLQDVANKPGASLSFGDLFGLADAISTALGDGFAGAVVTQGTDTIEETAYVLDLLVASDAPVGEHPGRGPGGGQRRRAGTRLRGRHERPDPCGPVGGEGAHRQPGGVHLAGLRAARSRRRR